MAIRLPDGSIQMADGRILYATSVILAADLIEILPLLTPPPAWPFVSGGGGGGGGPARPAGTHRLRRARARKAPLDLQDRSAAAPARKASRVSRERIPDL